MCVSPISIPNPNYCNRSKTSYLVDTKSRYIRVPCGHCDECIAVKQMSLVQRVQMESLKNHIFFSTMTYNNEMLPKIHTSTGFDIPYADYHDLNNVIRRIRRDHLFPRVFRYFAISELGSKNGRPHFHCLWLLPKFISDTYTDILNLENSMFDTLKSCWCRNVGSRKFPNYVPLFTYVRKFVCGKVKSNFDLHYVNPFLSESGVSDVGFYVLKYMLKPSDRASRLQRALKLNLPFDEYDRIWKVVKPRYFKSHDFGLARDPDISSRLHTDIDKLKFHFPYPVYVNPIDGSTFPLSRFYKGFGSIYDIDQATFFKLHYPDIDPDDPDQASLIKHSRRRDKLADFSDDDIFTNF